MKLIAAMMVGAAAFALAAGPAVAQMPPPSFALNPDKPTKTPEQREQDEIREKAYRESLKKIPDAKTANDPWGSVRNVDTPKPATAAKPKAKTGSNAN